MFGQIDNLKIAFISPFWGPAYPTGSGVYAAEISNLLVEMGHDVHVYASNIGNTKIKNSGAEVHFLKTYGNALGMNPLANPFFKIVESDFDVVHVHSYIFIMSNISAFSSKFSNFKYILQFHGVS